MLGSKTTGLMLITAFIILVFVIVPIILMGDAGTPTEIIDWAVSNSGTAEIVIMLNMIANILLIIFTVGFISWAHSIDNSNAAITIGKYSAVLALALLWIGDVSHMAALQTATDNTDYSDGLLRLAPNLIVLSHTLTWIGMLTILGSFFIVGATAYLKKVGTPVLNGLLAIVGIVGCVGGFIPTDMDWIFWVGGFLIGFILMGIIGVQKVMRS